MSAWKRAAGPIVWGLAAAAAVPGCAGPRAESGRALLEALEREERSARAPAVREPRRGLPADGPITLADLLSAAEASSPELASASSAVGMAAGRAWQASLYPNPRVDVTSEDLAWRDGVSEAKTTVGFTQPIVLGDRRRAAGQAADAERSARAAAVEVTRRAVYGEVAVLVARLVSIREQERLYAELHGVVDATLSAARARFEARAVPETDMIRPRVELHRVEAARARLREESRAASRELGLLVGVESVDPARLELEPGELGAIDLSAVEAVVAAEHPSLAAADREIEAAEARLKQVRAEVTPDLDVRVGVGYSGELDSGVVDLGAGMTVPLWDGREGDAMSARFAVMAARQERARAERDLRRELAVAVGEYEAARAQAEAFRDRVTPDARRAFEQATEGYRAGRSSFMDLLDAQRTLNDAQVTLAELTGAARVARARVVRIVGPGPFMGAGGIPDEQRPAGAEEQR